jgi:hypothetical protein
MNLPDAAAEEEEGPSGFISNYVRTTKYTPISFLPLFLLAAFKQAANTYFLFIGFLQLIPSVSPTEGVPLQWAPLSLILCVQGVVEILVDRKRGKADTTANGMPTQRVDKEGDKGVSNFSQNPATCCVSQQLKNYIRMVAVPLSLSLPLLSLFSLFSLPPPPPPPSFPPVVLTSIKWRDVKVGDILKIENREQAPADMLLLAVNFPEDGSSPTGICYVETKSLDGETNLKLR